MFIQKRLIGALIFSCLFFTITKTADAKSYESAPASAYQSGGHMWTDWFHWFKAKHRTRGRRTGSRGSNSGNRGSGGGPGGSRGQGNPTPEPLSLGLVSLATLGLGWGVRKRKAQIQS